MRRCRFFFTLLAIFVGACAHLSAAPTAIPDLKTCEVPTATQLTWLSSSWQNFTPFIRVCPVYAKRSKPVLLVVSVWAELYYEQQPSGAATVPLPKPLIFTVAGRNVGELPMNFPDDPPHELILTFKNWQEEFPYRVELRVKSPTASDDQMLAPLIWDKASRQYTAGS